MIGWRWYHISYYSGRRSSCSLRTILDTTDASNFNHFRLSPSLRRCCDCSPGPNQVCFSFPIPKCLFFIMIILFYCSTPVDINDRSQLLSIIKSCLGTKFINRWSEQACQIALDAVSTVIVDENGRREIDIKRYAKVEKVFL